MNSKSFLDAYKVLFDMAPFGIFIHDLTGRIRVANAAGAGSLGLEMQALINKNFSRYIAPDSQDTFAEYVRSVREKNRPETCEIRMMQRHRPLFYAKLHGITVPLTDTGDTGCLTMILGVNERKISDASPFQQGADTKEAPLITDAMMLSDINQPLAIIANYIYGCIYRLECKNFKITDVLRGMKQAERELHRLAEMIMRMKNFSCRDVLQYEDMEIDGVIEEIVSILNHETLSYPVSIVYRPVRSLPKTKLDKLYIQQAILNLARNAIDAMQDVSHADPRLIIEVNRLTKDRFEITISDNGPAFKIESAHRLFEPDFTTKPYGIGMGLLVSRIIVETHGGKLSAGISPTGGACFRLELPIFSATV